MTSDERPPDWVKAMEKRLNDRFDRIELRLSHMDKQIGRHTEILVQTQQAVNGLQSHLGLVPA